MQVLGYPKEQIGYVPLAITTWDLVSDMIEQKVNEVILYVKDQRVFVRFSSNMQVNHNHPLLLLRKNLLLKAAVRP